MSPATINIISTVVIALATAVNSVFVVILVQVTKQYTRITGEILKESRKAADAGQAQANAARASIAVFREQLENQLGLGRAIVQSAIQSALMHIEYWKSKEINLATSRILPRSDTLVPENATSAVEHARHLSAEGAEHLSAAFDNLRLAQNEIEGLRRADRNWPVIGAFKQAQDDRKAATFLEAAFRELQNAQKYLM